MKSECASQINVAPANGGFDIHFGSEEIDKFAAAYESSFNARIASLVKEHFALTRDKDGKKEFIVYMTIDEAAANKARHAAAEEAKNKANLGNLAEHLDEITNKPVEVE